MRVWIWTTSIFLSFTKNFCVVVPNKARNQKREKNQPISNTNMMLQRTMYHESTYKEDFLNRSLPRRREKTMHRYIHSRILSKWLEDIIHTLWSQYIYKSLIEKRKILLTYQTQKIVPILSRVREFCIFFSTWRFV